MNLPRFRCSLEAPVSLGPSLGFALAVVGLALWTPELLAQQAPPKPAAHKAPAKTAAAKKSSSKRR